MVALVCVAAALRAVACLSRAGCGDGFVTGAATCRRQAATPVSVSQDLFHPSSAVRVRIRYCGGWLLCRGRFKCLRRRHYRTRFFVGFDQIINDHPKLL